METDLERKDREQKQAARKKQEEARAQMAREAELHREAMSNEAKARAEELDLLMTDLKEPERRQIRLHAVVLTYQLGLAGEGDKQANIDAMMLKLARYTVLGQA